MLCLASGLTLFHCQIQKILMQLSHSLEFLINLREISEVKSTCRGLFPVMFVGVSVSTEPSGAFSVERNKLGYDVMELSSLYTT